MYGRVGGFEGKGHLVAATDAGYKNKDAGIAFVMSDGRWGLRHWSGRQDRRLDPTGPSKVLIMELRAVALACEARGGQIPDMLLIDSTKAIDYLRCWQAGNIGRMPAGYSLRPRYSRPDEKPTLVRLATLMAARPNIKIEHVRGHCGHPLNETADSLASIALRNEPTASARARATAQMEAFLPIWHSQWAATRPAAA
jgi:ribonuclease HI